MNKNFTVRFPSQTQLPINSEKAKFWDDRISELTNYVSANGIDIRSSSGDIKIRLAGKKISIHTHNKLSEAFAWVGEPTPGELMKAISVVVGIQVMDDAVHIPLSSPFNNLDSARVKPNVVYLPSDTPDLENNQYHLLHKQLETLIAAGTIGKTDTIDRIFRIARTKEEFVEALYEQKEIKKSIHHGDHEIIEFPDEWKKYGEHIIDKRFKSIQMPEFSGTCYTSANPNQPQIALDEATILAKLHAENNIGVITGAGCTGLMGAVGNSCIEYGGIHLGVQCPYIAVQEGLPKLTFLIMRPDIYFREADMYGRSEYAIIGAGGRGGSGTGKEAIDGLYLLTSRLNRYGLKNREERLGYSKIVHNKPIEIIFDNREKLWGPIIEIFKLNGLEEGKNYHIAEGSHRVFEHVMDIKERTYKAAKRVAGFGDANKYYHHI